ncbi:MAG TPA: hypothetical protein VJT74_13360 [Pyrinomonadaceae bacterium]|nr:hypothetical protein [Pyrinomonadaceae bacterium]
MKYPALTFILLVAASAHARALDFEDGCKGVDKKVAALAVEYRELRDRRRQLPQGVFDEELQADGGKFHDVLSALGVEMGRPPYTRRTITQCLGAPDAVKDSRQMRPFLDIYNREQRKAGREVASMKPGRSYLIYHWRGGHDFLFFISERGRIVDHGWWFAYE